MHINLTSLALILWSGMLVISGSIWILSSQVRKIADLLETHPHRASTEAQASASVNPAATVRVPRVNSRRSARSPRQVSARIRSGNMPNA